jgi:hypothetical protein
MKTKIKVWMVAIVVLGLQLTAWSETEERKVSAFSEISLRIPAKLYLEQGPVQKVTIDAKSSVKNEIITEISGRSLVIRFPAKNYFFRNLDPGSITIHITVPEISGLSLSGSGDIFAKGSLTTRIMDVNISGSGNVDLSDLLAERVKAVISGSGNIILKGSKPAAEFTGTISGSGNIKAQNFEAENVKANISGSGNCSIGSNGQCTVRIAGSGNFHYKGDPSIDSTVAGTGSIKEIK